jgi:hypothetical protein
MDKEVVEVSIRSEEIKKVIYQRYVASNDRDNSGGNESRRIVFNLGQVKIFDI